MVEDVCFLYKRRWKNTLKLRFLSQKIQEYRKEIREAIEGCLWLSGISRSIAYNWSRPNMKIGVRIIHATSSYRNVPVSRKGRSPGFLFYRKKRRSPGFLFNKKKRRKKPRFCVQQEEAQVVITKETIKGLRRLKRFCTFFHVLVGYIGSARFLSR
ncbi:hypothetical protein AAZX31_19G048000 [Glycine max]